MADLYGSMDEESPIETEAMDDSMLLALLKRLEQNSLGSEGSELAGDRETAQDYYLARATGRLSPPTEPDRTDVVSHALMEVVEWTLPEMLRIFTAEQPVEFLPTSPTDEIAARQQTQIVNHVISQLNSGYLLMRTWFHDALVERNGYLYCYWDDRTVERLDRYFGLYEDQRAMLFLKRGAGKDASEISVEEEVKHPQPDGTTTYDLTLRIREKAGQVCIENVPPERMRISEDAKGEISKASYVAMVELPTRSELIEWGFDKELVYSLAADIEGTSQSSQQTNRNVTRDEQETVEIDRSMDQIRVVIASVKLDYDGDGKAERRNIWHTGSTILLNEESNCVPFVSISPLPLPHRHVGLGFFDLVADLQEIDTFLDRQLLDNVFGSNHNELAVWHSQILDMDDVMVRRPNGVIRCMRSPGEVVQPVALDLNSDRILNVITYFDSKRETRTGVGRTSQGLDSEVLSEGTKGAFEQGLAASSAMREGIARNFAETGVRDVMLLTHKLMIEHQDYALDMLLNAGTAIQEWVPVDPRQWQHRAQMTVKVGLGDNSKQEERQALAFIGQIQMAAAQSGARITSPENVFNLAEDSVRAFGLPQRSNRYFTPPSKMPPAAPEENVLVTTQKIKSQTDAQVAMLRVKADLMKEAASAQGAEKQRLQDAVLAIVEMELKYGTDLAGIGLEHSREQAKQLLDVSEAHKDREAGREQAAESNAVKRETSQAKRTNGASTP